MSLFDDLRDYYREQPNEVSLETYAQCNARCTFCPYPTLERQGAKLPDALLERLVDEMAGFKYPIYFSPFKVNEPLLDKRLIPLCRTFNAKVPQSAIRLFTNGSGLTDANIEGIGWLRNVAHLWVSLNEHEPAAYEATMGLDFSQTSKRLDRLHATPFPFPVVVSRVGRNEAFIAYVQDRWPKFQVACLKRDAWIDFTSSDVPEVPDTACARWWEVNIAATGQAALCCMDGEAKYGFGNVHTQTLLEIYNHPTVRAWRDGFLSRKAAGVPCATCTY